MSLTDEPNPVRQVHPTGERRAEAERIRDAVWPPDESPEARQARIERNLAALRSLEPWPLGPADWKLIDQASVFDEDEE
jgi:hypothetical protein